MVLVCFLGSLATAKATKYAFMNSEPSSMRQMLIDLNLNKLHYYLFIISMRRYNGSFDTVEDQFGRIHIPNKVEELKVFKIFNKRRKSI